MSETKDAIDIALANLKKMLDDIKVRPASVLEQNDVNREIEKLVFYIDRYLIMEK